MARTVSPEHVWADKTLRGAKTDWAQYCDGQTWELRRGEDFEDKVSAHSKRSTFRQWASRNGYEPGLVHSPLTDDGEGFFIYVEGGDAAKAEA